MLYLVLIDNCVVLLVNVYAVFIVQERLTLITFKNKQTNNTTFVNLRGAFIRFILCDVNLSSEVCFDSVIWFWECYQLTDLISNFFRSFIKISQFVSRFGVFITNKKEGEQNLLNTVL